jgi:hypothetical protein
MQKLSSLPSTRKLRTYRSVKTENNIDTSTALDIVS